MNTLGKNCEVEQVTNGPNVWVCTYLNYGKSSFPSDQFTTTIIRKSPISLSSFAHLQVSNGVTTITCENDPDAFGLFTHNGKFYHGSLANLDNVTKAIEAFIESDRQVISLLLTYDRHRLKEHSELLRSTGATLTPAPLRHQSIS